MWEMYDDLINSIPEDLCVQDCLVGLHWTLVQSESGTGAAMTLKGGKGRKDGNSFPDLVGMSVKELAAYIKSWNLIEASLGQAAINSVFNVPQNVAAVTGKPLADTVNSEEIKGFRRFLPEIEGKKVAVIGHFPNIESLNIVCRLSILERNPQENDYPDPACEYILPEQDVVFITGTAFINKTMPRLLELSKNARIILVGPSVPISPVLFQYGVDTIASTVIIDEKRVWRIAKQGGRMRIFQQGGQMVYIRN